MGKAKAIVKKLTTTKGSFTQFPKEKHQYNLEKSQKFKYCTQIYFENKEKCDSDRFISIALSQGLIQDILKIDEDKIKREIIEFEEICNEIKQEEMYVSYTCNIGIK